MDGSKSGTVGLHPAIFQHWRDAKSFIDDFQTSCEIHGLRAGLQFAVDRAKLQVVVDNWVADGDRWLRDRLPEENVRINHLKQGAILLHWLCRMDPVRVAGRVSDFEHEMSVQDGGGSRPNLQVYSVEDQRRFEHGGSKYLSWLFVYSVVEWFEKLRLDKQSKFATRITAQLEHDIMHYLRQNNHDADTLYMVLSALFVRD